MDIEVTQHYKSCGLQYQIRDYPKKKPGKTLSRIPKSVGLLRRGGKRRALQVWFSARLDGSGGRRPRTCVQSPASGAVSLNQQSLPSARIASGPRIRLYCSPLKGPAWLSPVRIPGACPLQGAWAPRPASPAQNQAGRPFPSGVGKAGKGRDAGEGVCSLGPTPRCAAISASCASTPFSPPLLLPAVEVLRDLGQEAAPSAPPARLHPLPVSRRPQHAEGTLLLPPPQGAAKGPPAPPAGLRMPRKRQRKKAQPDEVEPPGTGTGAEETAGPSPPPPLQEELERVCRHLDGLRGRRAQLRVQHEFLEREAQELRAQSLEFMGYLAKRAQRRQGLAVSLGEESQRRLGETQQESREVLARYQAQEAALRGQLLDKEAELGSLCAELDALCWVPALREEQASRLRALREEQAAARKQQVQRLQAARVAFVKEKAARAQEAQEKAALWARQAREVAGGCLQEHSRAVQRQNRALREELLQLVQRARELQAHKSRLQERLRRLRQQHDYLRDLALLRRGPGVEEEGPAAEAGSQGRPGNATGRCAC
ncbi:leucine zipper putative tumor suppressor 2-like [Rhineura floridana]|uniref:leucine zipper putative tumor suppressor 2-like n=1 Tax=Rhineura floridana TaxID=261503 RepID=UPI002AC81DD7|nr:leucine zipper putative tumor suppressor 2-like [Rhineura floridana]